VRRVQGRGGEDHFIAAQINNDDICLRDRFHQECKVNLARHKGVPQALGDINRQFAFQAGSGSAVAIQVLRGPACHPVSEDPSLMDFCTVAEAEKASTAD
jgi:hypothetical protein